MKKREMKKLMCLIAVIMSAVMLFSACSEKKTENPIAVSIVIGNHECSAELDVTNQKIQETVTLAVASFGFLSIVSVDGEPEIVAKGSCDIKEQYKNADPSKLAADATSKTLTIVNSLPDVVANDPEVDTLEAIRLAASSLSEAPDSAPKIIIVMDTGLCTTGLLDYHNNLLNADPKAVVDALEEKKAIPKLNGMEVRWFYMGEVSYPQEKLSPKQKAQLAEVWKGIIERGGGTFVHEEMPSVGKDIDRELPSVSPIDIEKEQSVSFDSAMLDGESNPFAEPTFLREEQVRFVADSDEYVDSDAVASTILPIAEYMNQHPDFQLLLIGTTAGDGASDYAISLSNSRANAVKKTLISQGVLADRIYTLGMGGTDPWHIYNVGTSGELAAQNRKVVLLDASSQLAKELMQ